MANPYHPYQSEANMMAALAANSAILEARLKQKSGNIRAALQRNKEIQSILQRREEEVKNYLEEVGLEKIKTDADGNCFFYAVQGYADIKGRENMSVSVEKLRNAVAETIETKHDKYSPYFALNAELKAHVSNIRKLNTWADEVDVAAFSDHFKVCIVVHDWRETNDPPYHMAQISYPNNCDIGRNANPARIHILRTNMNHYSLLMPVNDPEYNVIKLFVGENVSLPLTSAVAIAHQNQLKQMANQASENLSGFRLNQPRPLPGNARNASWRLPQAAASSSSVPINVLQKHAKNATNAMAEVQLESESQRLARHISKLEQQIATLRSLIAQKKDKKKLSETLSEKQAQLAEKRRQLSLIQGGTRKHKKLRRTCHKQNKNNRKSLRKIRK
jgi:DNA repair exonuclease SbcCD ATPase subunit